MFLPLPLILNKSEQVPGTQPGTRQVALLIWPSGWVLKKRKSATDLCKIIESECVLSSGAGARVAKRQADP
jgi:hypothetical protein